jgi:hypothetical protein
MIGSSTMTPRQRAERFRDGYLAAAKALRDSPCIISDGPKTVASHEKMAGIWNAVLASGDLG